MSAKPRSFIHADVDVGEPLGSVSETLPTRLSVRTLPARQESSMRLIQFTKQIAMVALVVAGFAGAPSRLLAQLVASPSKAPYLDPLLPIDQRVDDLVSQMTLEEKASQ